MIEETFYCIVHGDRSVGIHGGMDRIRVQLLDQDKNDDCTMSMIKDALRDAFDYDAVQTEEERKAEASGDQKQEDSMWRQWLQDQIRETFGYTQTVEKFIANNLPDNLK